MLSDMLLMAVLNCRLFWRHCW